MTARRSLIALIGLLAFVGHGRALAGSFGTELPFVLGTGARASGLGITGVSFGDDPSVQYFNPSGLSYLEWKQFVFYKSTLFDSDTGYHTLSYAQPLLSHGTVAITIMRVDVSGIEERDETNQLLSDDLHDSQTRVLLGYARPFGSNFAAGFNVKIDNHSFGTSSGSGIGLDVGLSAQQSISGSRFIKGFREGLMIRNLLEPSVKLDVERVADPMSIGLGVSMISGFEQILLLTSLELENPRFSPVTLHVGQEVTYDGHYSLRFGLDSGSPTFGFGAAYQNLALDYAYQGEDFGNSHRISFSVKFGASLTEQRARARLEREREVDARISERMDELEKSQIDRALATGERLLTEKDYTGALGHFEIALLWDPDNPKALDLANRCRYEEALSQGASEMDRENYVGALVHLKKALTYAPDDRKASTMVTVCSQRIDEAQNSAEAINRTLKTAIDLYADGQYADAMAGFQEVLNISPRNEFAQEYLDKCIMSIRSNVDRLQRDAEVLARRGDYDGAIRLLEDALVYNNQHGGVRSQINEYKKRRAEAATAAADVTIPQPELSETTLSPIVVQRLDERYNEGMKHFNDGEFDLAIRKLLEVWTVKPDYHNAADFLTKAYLLVGMNHYSEHNYEEAIQTWEKALTIDPGNSKAKRYLNKANEEIRKLSGVSNDG